MTIEEAQKIVDEWIKTHGVRYFNELTNMTLLTEEVGELARIVARTYGAYSGGPGNIHGMQTESVQTAVPEQSLGWKTLLPDYSAQYRQ